MAVTDDALVVLVILGVGFALGYLVARARKKLWFLECMNPREIYELGREKELIVNLNISKRQFNGFKAGKYTILLLWGDISTFSKHVLQGKIEEMYLHLLSESLFGRGLLTRVERMRFFNFLHRYMPKLSTKAFMLTAELVSPQDVLDMYWTAGKERDDALSEMKIRRLIDSKVLWVKPYPPEKDLKDIMTGIVTIPDIYQNHQKEYTRLVVSQSKTLVAIDSSTAELLTEIIPWARNIIDSITDPTVVLGMILADRARQLEGIGLEQLSEHGGIESLIMVAERLMQYKEKFVKALGEKPSTEHLTKIDALLKQVADMQAKLEAFEKKAGVKPEAQAPKA